LPNSSTCKFYKSIDHPKRLNFLLLAEIIPMYRMGND